jgi:hypothetical protein
MHNRRSRFGVGKGIEPSVISRNVDPFHVSHGSPPEYR